MRDDWVIALFRPSLPCEKHWSFPARSSAFARKEAGAGCDPAWPYIAGCAYAAGETWAPLVPSVPARLLCRSFLWLYYTLRRSEYNLLLFDAGHVDVVQPTLV